MKIPTLTTLRNFINKNKLNGWWNTWRRGNGLKNEDFFAGNCHYASKALSEFITGGLRHVVRGWYTETDALKDDPTWIRNGMGHIAHSWVEIDGKIIDPTWWAFHPGEPVKVYQFDAGDPRYHTENPR